MRGQFESIPDVVSDPVAIAASKWPEFKQKHPDAINTTIGVLRDPETESPWRSDTVRYARQQAFLDIDSTQDFGYQPVLGHQEFLELSAAHTLGAHAGPNQEVLSFQTVGGINSLYIAREMIKVLHPDQSTPLVLDEGWGNHRGIFAGSFDITSHRHLDPETSSYDHSATLSALESVTDGSIALMQVSGYNDDGLDRSIEQWIDVINLVHQKRHTLVLDAAYLGLGRFGGSDQVPIRMAAEKGILTFVCLSYSKNMGLYNERLGALHVINGDKHFSADNLDRLERHGRQAVRTSISNPPKPVALAAANVLRGESGARFADELSKAKESIDQRRKDLAEIIGEHALIIAKGSGLFTRLYTEGFSPAQLEELASLDIFALPTSRINISGIPPRRLEQVGEALKHVIDMGNM